MSNRTFWDEPRPSVSTCTECGKALSSFEDITPGTQCKSCKAPLHTCRGCSYFDSGAENECRQPVKVRIAKKREDNDCGSFKPRLAVDLMGSKADSGDTARRAFDDLFKA